MRVLIQLRPAADVVAEVINPEVITTAESVAGPLRGVVLDESFVPVPVPRPIPVAADADPVSLSQEMAYSLAPEEASVVVRGEIADNELAARISMLQVANPQIVGVFADPVIETTLTCGGDSPIGKAQDVAQLLQVVDFDAAGLDGAGVALAIVDTGINADHLSAALRRPVTVDVTRSWTPPSASGRPGEWPVHHGTMCAYDALIAAPQATLLDVAVLRSERPGGSALEGLLSDAVAAYAHLRTVLDAQPEDQRALVVSNSWGSFSPAWDFPPGHPGNYSDNPAHPFNVIVSSLERAGADILFAAGNCGRDCPDRRCRFPSRPIAGANSHPQVLSIGGLDVNGNRVGYSSQGPGRLAQRKPDLCAYTHFAGSRAFGDDAPDSGTSAACPVAAGLVAATRTNWPTSKLTASQLRSLLRRTADDRSDVGFDYDYGYGVIDAAGVLSALERRKKRNDANG